MGFPKGSCTQIAYTLAPKYPYRDYIKAKVYTICAHGPLNPIEPLKEPLKEPFWAHGPLGFRVGNRRQEEARQRQEAEAEEKRRREEERYLED